MQNILYIADANPALKNGHGKMISMHHSIIKEIFPDHLYTIYGFGENEYHEGKTWQIPNNDKKGKMVSVLKRRPAYLSSAAEKKIFSIIKEEKIECVYFDNSISGVIIKKIKKMYPNIGVVVYFPDIEKALMGQQIQAAKLYRKISLRIMIQNELITSRYADHCIVLNNRDAELFTRYYGKKPDSIIPIVVPMPQLSETCASHHSDTILNLLFVGIDYKPNVDGIEWLIKEVLSKLKVPFTLKIVGYRMEQYKETWEELNPNVSVIGTVDALLPYYENADVVIAPISEGGGMKVKTAEAFSYGKKFIGLPESLEGYWEQMPDSLRERDVFRVRSAEQFACAIQSLYDSDFYKRSAELINWTKNTFSYESIRDSYKKAFFELGSLTIE